MNLGKKIDPLLWLDPIKEKIEKISKISLTIRRFQDNMAPIKISLMSKQIQDKQVLNFSYILK